MQSKSSVGILLVVSVAVALAHPHDVVAGPCACNSDVNNNVFVNAIDIDIVKNCINGVNCGLCVNSCDVDCDGDVDYYDAGVVSCAHQGQSNCCNEPDGACTGANYTPACVNTTDNYCDVFSGTWHGDESLCVNNVLVPTVSTWGLLVLGISILIAATLVLQRRTLGSVVA